MEICGGPAGADPGLLEGRSPRQAGRRGVSTLRSSSGVETMTARSKLVTCRTSTCAAFYYSRLAPWKSHALTIRIYAIFTIVSVYSLSFSLVPYEVLAVSSFNILRRGSCMPIIRSCMVGLCWLSAVMCCLSVVLWIYMVVMVVSGCAGCICGH